MNDGLEENATTPLYELPPTPTLEATQEEPEVQLTRGESLKHVTTPATDQPAVEEEILLLEPPVMALGPASPVPAADPETDESLIAAKAASLPSEPKQNQHDSSDLHSLKPTDLLGICLYLIGGA